MKACKMGRPSLPTSTDIHYHWLFSLFLSFSFLFLPSLSLCFSPFSLSFLSLSLSLSLSLFLSSLSLSLFSLSSLSLSLSCGHTCVIYRHLCRGFDNSKKKIMYEKPDVRNFPQFTKSGTKNSRVRKTWLSTHSLAILRAQSTTCEDHVSRAQAWCSLMIRAINLWRRRLYPCQVWPSRRARQRKRLCT